MIKKIKLHPLFFATIIFLCFCGFWNFTISYLLAVLFHEMGHAYVAKKLGYTLNKLYLLPYGACLSYEEFAFNSKDEVKIALAGPVVNLVFFTFFVTLWWIFPETYNYTYNFVFANFVTAIFNFLPAFPLDGARVFIAIMSEKNKRKLAYKICTIFNMIMSFLLFVLCIVSVFFQFNITYGTMSVFLFLGIIESKFQGKYSPVLFEMSKTKYDKVLSVKNIYVPAKTQLYKVLKELNAHKFNVIYIKFSNGTTKQITEIQFKEMLENFSIDTTFESAFLMTKIKTGKIGGLLPKLK